MLKEYKIERLTRDEKEIINRIKADQTARRDTVLSWREGHIPMNAILRRAELEDMLESGKLREVNNKPLTVEELKALQVGDWVWLVVLKDDLINKAHNGKYYHKQLGLESLIDKEFWCGWQGYGTAFEYADYGTKWLAYKNKEQAEARLEELRSQ